MNNNHRQDVIDVTGEITMVCVSRPRMVIRLDDGREIEAAFRSEDEDIVTTALKQHRTARLRVIGRGRRSADGQVENITEVSDTILVPNGQIPSAAPAKPIWKKFAEIAAGIPNNELERLPADGAARLDEYLYGNAQDD